MLQLKNSVAAGPKAAWVVGACLGTLTLLGACGQKGTLFLPKAPAASAAASAASAASPASAP